MVKSGEGEFQKLRIWTYVKDAWDYIPEYTEAMFDGDEKGLDEYDYDPDGVIEKTLRCRVRGCEFHTASWFDALPSAEFVPMVPR